MFKMIFDTNNAAFDGNPTKELARICREVAIKLTEGHHSRSIYDSSGNRIGFFEFDRYRNTRD